MPKLRLLFVALFCYSFASGQVNLEQFKLNFRNIGPSGMSGRITAIDVDLSDSDRIYAGSASGGVWLSENGGTTWEPIFDGQECLSIGSIKINQRNTDEIWVGTGEGNPRNSLNTGCGIFKTMDGGKTWKRMGLAETKVVHRIIIDQHEPETVYAGCMGSPWGDSDRGLYKTTDGGKTWERKLYVDQRTGVADMVQDPTNHKKLIVAMYDHRRTPWDFTSGGKGSGLHITYDGGDTWQQVTSDEGLPEGDLGRMGVAIAPSQPDLVYALVEAKENGLYKSTDGGKKWSLVSKKNIGNRPFYYSEIYVDPYNENRIWNLWSYVSKSEDGGKTFETVMDYGNNVHPDHHALWIHPEDPSYIINGNDGGMNISRDRGENWQFINNLPVGQFYHVNIDNDWPYNVYGGMQDNGSWVGPSMVLKRGGIRNYDYQELYFGDGFDVAPFPTDSRYGWAMSQGGNLGYYDRETGATKFVKPRHPDDEPLRFNWNAPIAQDPFSDCGVYYGSQYLHYTDNCGDSWTLLSGDLSTNDEQKQQQDKSGGLTIDATFAENNTTILSIAPSPADRDVIYVGTDDGRLHVTTDRGANWTDVYGKLQGAPKAAFVPQIEVSKTNSGEAFVVLNNYRQNDYSAYVYHTKDHGKSWTRIIDDSKVGGFVKTVVQDLEQPKLLFAGTDVGLYFSLDYGKNWQRFSGEDFPHVQVSDLKIHPRDGDLVIGTFGRAFWILDDLTPLRSLASAGMSQLKDSLTVYGSPIAYQASMRSYDGIRFNAQGEWVGDNKSINSSKITVHTPATDKKDGKRKLKVQIVDSSGDTIRTFHKEVASGLQSIYWRGETDGKPAPDAKDDDDAPRGLRVLPGEYIAVVSYGNHSGSTALRIAADPRMTVSDADRKAKQNKLKELQSYSDMLESANYNLDQVRGSMKTVKGLLDTQPDSIQTQLKDQHKALTKAIDSLKLMYEMPDDIKGIQRNPANVSSKMGRARWYNSSQWGAPTPNSELAASSAIKSATTYIKAVERFLSDEYGLYKTLVESLDLSPLKKLDGLKQE